jgi:hypothetical protein
MKTILVVYPVLGCYGQNPVKHMKLLASKCKSKKTAIIFSNLSNDEADDKNEDDFEDYDYSGYNPGIEIPFELVQRDYGQTSSYWVEVLNTIPNTELINLAASMSEIKSLNYQAAIETACRERNYLKTHAHFLEMFGPVHEIYEDIKHEEAEFIITDAYVGTCLSAMYPQEFIIEYEYPMDFHVDLEKHTVWESVKEFQAFHKWSIDSRPYLAGSYNSPHLGQIWFELFCTPVACMGKVQGIISDGFGLASFHGTNRDTLFRFQKSYFNLAIRGDESRWIEDRPIFYEFNPQRREGKYSWEYYPSDVGALYTKSFAARAMYNIKEK